MSRTHVHTTITGIEIEFEAPTKREEAFLSTLERMAGDPKVTSGEMRAFAFAPDNPIFDPEPFPERGPFTRELLANPLFHVQNDMLFRKRVAVGEVDFERFAAAFTVPLVEAAKQLNRRDNTLRMAIYARRLCAFRRPEGYYVSPASIRAYAEAHGERRGDDAMDRGAALALCYGNEPGRSFRVRFDGKFREESRQGKVIAGTLSDWTTLGIIAGESGSYRFFEVAPGETDAAVEFGPFYARGRVVVRKVNNSRKACEEFDQFKARFEEQERARPQSE